MSVIKKNAFVTSYSRKTRRAFYHDDVIKWKHFPRYWPFVRGIHRSSVNSPHKGQWRRALMFSFICVWITVRVNNREAGDLRRYRAHYDVIVMTPLRGVLPHLTITNNLFKPLRVNKGLIKVTRCWIIINPLKHHWNKKKSGRISGIRPRSLITQ